MITKQEFDAAAKKVASNFGAFLPKMVSYKNYVQKAVLNVATQRELLDVRDCRINQGLIDKLCGIANREWLLSKDAESLYCSSIAVGTIIKEYDWGTRYVTGEGPWEIAQRIQKV